jgi:uncharacterized protein (DUF983 family)
MKFILAILRSLRLRCPNCHQGRLMKNWFVIHESCGVCGYEFLKETGDFWGGMVFSYTYAGFVALVTTGILVLADALTWGNRVYVAVICGVVAIVVLHPFTRANWVTVMFLTRGHYEDYRPPKAQP